MAEITVNEASKLTGTPEVTIRRWIKEGKIIANKNEDNNYLIDKRSMLLQQPTVFTFFIEKGGTGKTAVVSLLADYYANMGLKVLITGLDPQINIEKKYYDYTDLKDKKSIYDYFENSTPLNKIVLEYSDNIHILPASKKLSKKRYQYETLEMGGFADDFLAFYKKYDVVLQDCGPVVDSLSRFGILTANYVLIPFVPEPDSYDGLLDAINAMKPIADYSPRFIGFKAIINNHDQSGRYGLAIHNQYIEKAHNELKHFVTKGSIPSFVGVKERRNAKKNIFVTYTEHKFIDQIKSVLNEIDTMAFEERK